MGDLHGESNGTPDNAAMKNPGIVESSEPNHDRQSMVESQLKTRGVDDERVLKAMVIVPRTAAAA